LSSSLLGVLAQRLVRLLCPHCRQPHMLTAAERNMLGLADDAVHTVFRPVGCEQCNQTGYRGRTGIYELVMVDETLREMIHDRASEQSLERHARQSTPGIRVDGWRKVLAGETSIEEVLRVTREN
jgi:general secretion pathway protein E